ncbi:MAG TPA: hypothetical protein PK992_19230 [Planctomycetaceae bacterium]|nr:hypothetical protein [Planctomycetaceae bacterium]
MNGERKHPVFLVVDEFQRIVAGNLEYILQRARSMNVGVILANQSMEDPRTRATDLIPTLEANCRYRQWFAVSSSDDRARVVANSGETMEDFVTRSFSENGESYTYVPKLMPRLSQNDVLLITDHPKQSIVILTDSRCVLLLLHILDWQLRRRSWHGRQTTMSRISSLFPVGFVRDGDNPIV